MQCGNITKIVAASNSIFIFSISFLFFADEARYFDLRYTLTSFKRIKVKYAFIKVVVLLIVISLPPSPPPQPSLAQQEHFYFHFLLSVSPNGLRGKGILI